MKHIDLPIKDIDNESSGGLNVRKVFAHEHFI